VAFGRARLVGGRTARTSRPNTCSGRNYRRPPPQPGTDAPDTDTSLRLLASVNDG